MNMLPAAVVFVAVTLPAVTGSAAPAGPGCDVVHAAFTSGSYSSREAIVDALQAHLAAAGARKALGRDGQVQAIVLAVTRCGELGHGDFMAALDRSTAQVAQERAQHRSDD